MPILALPEKECLQCKSSFEPARSWQKFCSTDCRDLHHQRDRISLSRDKLKQVFLTHFITTGTEIPDEKYCLILQDLGFTLTEEEFFMANP